MPDGCGRIVVLYGNNGEGKTNILEAISIFSNLGGFRRSKHDELINNRSNGRHWNVILETEISEFSSGYFENENTSKRSFKVGDKSVRNLNAFHDDNYVLWLTYESDRLFMQSPSGRRDFLDMMCCIKAREHAVNVRDYEKLTRERIKILKGYNEAYGLKKDIDSWLTIVENKISELGLRIVSDRVRVVKELEDSQLEGVEFPRFRNWMSGPIEDGVMRPHSGQPLDEYVSTLKNRRQKDGLLCSTTVGPNRSDWMVERASDGMPARLCSAGEQKMLLIAAFFAFVMTSLRNDRRSMILLLDDVVSHLDHRHRALIFKYVSAIVNNYPEKSNIWMSGPEKGLFEGLDGDAEFFEIHNRNIERTIQK
jgi:DNA replication and repair protein RecF